SQYRGKVIWVCGGPFSIPRTPSKFTSTGYKADTGGPVPWHAQIPLHIGIVGKHVAKFIKGQIKRISITCTHQFPVLSFGIYMGDPSSRGLSAIGMATGIFDQWKKIVALPDLGQSVGVHFRQIGMVARYNIKGFPIRGHYYTMGAMLAGLTGQFPDHGNLIE